MRNVYLFQPQYSIQRKNGISYWLPYSVGCIWSYCNQYKDIKDNFNLKKMFFKREHPEKILKQLDNPSLCGFSCYVWNEQYCLGVAKLIKQQYPNCIIEFGGPQASKKMLDENSFIDTVIIAEGEENFLDLLRSILNNQEIKKYYQRTRLLSLDFPSPYQSGLFSDIIKENPDVIWATVLETNRGCPHRCTFCDWGGTTMSKIEKFDMVRILEDFDWVSKHNIEFIFFADANFGMYKERDLEIAKLVKQKFTNTKVKETIFQFSKNSTEVVFEISKILGNFLYRGITVSVQSMNEPTLKAIKRKNLNVNDIKNHMILSEKYDVRTYTELILPLPEETLETWKNGICELLEYGQHDSIEVWFCELLGNSELGNDLSRNMYGLKSVRAVDYMTISRDDEEYGGFKEIIELVNETNTMNIDDIVEAYMYFWMILNFHLNGYSQICSNYLRYIDHITYRSFYDCLYNYVKEDDGLIGNCFDEMEKIIYNYLTKGILPQNKKGHFLELNNSIDYMTFIENKSDVFNILKKCALNFPTIKEKIWEMQLKFVYDPEVEYPIKVTSPINIKTWENVKTIYEISNTRDISLRNDIKELKRIYLLKNKIKEVIS